MTAVLLALLTALAYGFANFLGPRLSLVHGLAPVLVVGQVVGAVGAAGLVLASGAVRPDASGLLLGVLAGVANAVAIGCFFTAAARGPMSVVAPVGALGGMVPVLVGLATGERPSVVQLVGIPLAVAGAAAAAARPADPSRAQLSRSTLLLTLFSAVVFGLFLTSFAEASESGATWAVLSSRLALLASTVVWFVVRRKALWVPARDLGRTAVPGFLLLVGTASFGIATTRGLLSVVSVIATLAPVVVVVLAVVLLHERLAARQWAGVALAMTGVVLIAAG